MARPKKEIDQVEFEKLCGIQCTKEEISDWFDCSEDTVERWCKRTYKESFAVVFAKKRVNGKISLRRTQFKLAEKSSAMAIWLGKQYLGQKENTEYTITGTDPLVKLLERLDKETEGKQNVAE